MKPVKIPSSLWMQVTELTIPIKRNAAGRGRPRRLGLTTSLLLSLPILGSVLVSPVVCGQVTYFVPERFAVIDAIPTELSGEGNQDSEPSLAVGTGANYGKFVLHAKTQSSPFNIGPFQRYYTTTSASSFGQPWDNPFTSSDGDYGTTLDWSSSGTCYAAMIRLPPLSLSVWQSSDPTAGVPFTDIASGDYTIYPDFLPLAQPCIKVVDVDNTDHILVGFNDPSKYFGATASVHYSLDGGINWNTTVIEKTIPGAGFDFPSVRLAASSDGTTVYALFQRATAPAGPQDYTGDVVLMRDDGYGGLDYVGLGNGTLVAHNIVIPNGTYMVAGGQPPIQSTQHMSGPSDVATDPADPRRVYVAYTELVNGAPVLRVQASTDSGASFVPVYSVANASFPALAVATDRTVGLLYLVLNGNELEVHFLKAFSGSFSPSDIEERVLAKFPDNNPQAIYLTDYLGSSFTLRAVNFNFFGTFCASADPKLNDFPSGVYYQRNVKVNGTVINNSQLLSDGTLVDLSGNNVSPSIDPFFFYDIASSLRMFNVRYKPKAFHDTGDPLSGIEHLVWPEIGPHEPQFQLFTSSALGADASWVSDMGNALQSNGQFESVFLGPQPQAFFRLKQNLAGAQFQVFAGAGNQGSFGPGGIVTVPSAASLTFRAVPRNNFAVSQWTLDGAVVQSGGSTLTLSNIIAEHTLVATFVASNDLAVTLADIPIIPGPTKTFGTNIYAMNIQNQGLTTLNGITMANQLPPTVSFLSAFSSQGTVANSGGVVIANLGTLSPGASAVVDIAFVPQVAGSITDVVNVACAQMESDLANNTATDVATVIDPVMITNQPASQTVIQGGTVILNVGVSGTPPFLYQWFFNSNVIAGATSSSLGLTNITPSQAGFYSASVFQTFGGGGDVLIADSTAAQLTVAPVSSLAVSPGATRPLSQPKRVNQALHNQ